MQYNTTSFPPNAVVNPQRVVLARESRGLNQAELNEMLAYSPGMLSKYERGEIRIPAETLTRIAELTRYPLSFFTQPGGSHTNSLAWRQREKVAQKLINTVNARVSILRLIVQGLIRDLMIGSPLFPFMVLSDELTPQDVARALRQTWNIPAGPIANLTAVVEGAGIPVAPFQFDTDRIDSRAALTEDRYPLICINSNHPGDRQRFSLAYQLGNLLMHTFSNVPEDHNTGHEANLFAAEFLMPEADIRKDIGDRPVTLTLLAELKRKWKTSMISLLYRAADLGFITDNQKRYMVTQFNTLKLRRNEPTELDVTPEQPTLIRTWLATLKRRQSLSTPSLIAHLHLTPEDYVILFG